jgi:type VI secretion system protein ImpK
MTPTPAGNMPASSSVAPSLLAAGTATNYAGVFDNSRQANSLMDLMYDGFYMLFLLKNRHHPADEATFAVRINRFLDEFEKGAKKIDVNIEDIYSAKYAFCAAVDETILSSQFKIRDAWERRPLQLLVFGDQLAGENFYNRLEQLRSKGATHVQALEVYHLCLLLGFKGKYIIEGQEKLSYLTARLGDEIALLKGKRAAFSPHWQRPDQVVHALKREVPIWVIGSVFALMGLLAFLGLRTMLTRSTESNLQSYVNVVKLAPKAASLTITLP